MQVTFDTNDNLEDLKRVFSILTESIQKKGGNIIINQSNNHVQQPSANLQTKQEPPNSRTSGGCRVIPYEDLSGKLSEIFSHTKIRY